MVFNVFHSNGCAVGVAASMISGCHSPHLSGGGGSGGANLINATPSRAAGFKRLNV